MTRDAAFARMTGEAACAGMTEGGTELSPRRKPGAQKWRKGS